MPDHVYRLTEVVGTSSESVDKAVRAAVERASRTLKGLDWFEVQEVRGTIRDGSINEYQVKVKIGFRLMEPGELKGSASEMFEGSEPFAEETME